MAPVLENFKDGWNPLRSGIYKWPKFITLLRFSRNNVKPALEGDYRIKR